MKKKSLVVNSIFNTTYTILNLFFPLVTTIYISRILLTDGVGRVDYARNIVSYFVTFAPLGIPIYGVREIAKVQNCQQEKNKVYTELIIINAISTLICTIVYGILCITVERFSQNLLLYMCTGLLLFFNYINVDWLYQGEEEYVYITIRNIVIKVASLFAMLLCVKTANDYIIYAFIMSMANGCNYIFNIIHSRKFVRIVTKDISLKRHIKPVFIIAAGILFSEIYGKIDITMLGSMLGNEAVANYSNANKLIAVSISLCTASCNVFLPQISRTFKNGDEGFYRLLLLGEQIICFIAFPATLGMILIADKLVVLLYGGVFAGAVNAVKVLAIMILIKGFGNLFCYQLMMGTGYERIRIPSSLMASIANIVLNVILIPYFAQVGAAIASIVSELILNSYQYIMIKKKLDLRLKMKPLFDAIVSSIVMGIVVLFVLQIGLTDVISLIVSVFFGVTVYIITNMYLRNDIVFQMISKMKKCFRKN